MLKLGEAITRKRKLILVVAVLLLIPSVLGMIATRINYDVLSYLPDDIQTIKGQDILLDDFGKGGFAMVMVDGMDQKDVSALKSKFEDVDHVDSVIWYDSIVDSSVPLEMVPGDVYKKFNSGDTTLMAVFFDGGNLGRRQSGGCGQDQADRRETVFCQQYDCICRGPEGAG